MSTIEKIKNANEEQLSDMFCSLIQAAASRVDVNCVCELCPVSEKCGKGSPGFSAWLKDTTEMNFNKYIIELQEI